MIVSITITAIIIICIIITITIIMHRVGFLHELELLGVPAPIGVALQDLLAVGA